MIAHRFASRGEAAALMLLLWLAASVCVAQQGAPATGPATAPAAAPVIAPAIAPVIAPAIAPVMPVMPDSSSVPAGPAISAVQPCSPEVTTACDPDAEGSAAAAVIVSSRDTEQPEARPITAAPVAMLNGGAPVYLYTEPARGIHYSAGISSGYDSAVDDVPQLGGGILSMEGYLGTLLRTRRFDLLLQQDANFTQSYGTSLGAQQYQHTAASFQGAAGRSTAWSFSLENGFGSDSARLLGNLNSTILGTIAVPNRDVAALGLNSGNVLTTQALLAFDHQLSETRTLGLSLSTFYDHFFENDTSNKQFSLSGRYRNQFSERSSLGVYSQLARQYFAAAQCTTESFGVLASSRLTRATQLEASAGPVLGSAACVRSGSYEFSASVTASMPRSTTVYLGGGRQRSDGLVQAATWQSSVFAGFAAGQPRHTRVRLDAGFADYTLVEPTPASSHIHGVFLSGELHRRLSSALEVSLTARRLTQSPVPATLNRNLVLVTLSWSPVRHVSRQAVLEGQDGIR